MKNIENAQKMGKFYPICLILFILTVFCANLFKTTVLGSQNLDAAPFSAETTLERLETPEKPAEIAKNFTSSAEKTQKPTKTVSSEVNFSAKIIDVSDMIYNGNQYYNTFAIMHNTVYNRFYYAHSTGAFKNLSSLSVGQTFILGGTRYEVKAVSRLTYAETQSEMRKIAGAYYSGTQYDISMMTCSGANDSSLPNGTADHRVIVYADRV